MQPAAIGAVSTRTEDGPPNETVAIRFSPFSVPARFHVRRDAMGVRAAGESDRAIDGETLRLNIIALIMVHFCKDII